MASRLSRASTIWVLINFVSWPWFSYQVGSSYSPWVGNIDPQLHTVPRIVLLTIPRWWTKSHSLPGPRLLTRTACWSNRTVQGSRILTMSFWGKLKGLPKVYRCSHPWSCVSSSKWHETVPRLPYQGKYSTGDRLDSAVLTPSTLDTYLIGNRLIRASGINTSWAEACKCHHARLTHQSGVSPSMQFSSEFKSFINLNILQTFFWIFAIRVRYNHGRV